MPLATIRNADAPLTLSYVDEGEGLPILLIHGFASSKQVNWVNTGWVAALRASGFRVVAFDNRGHGASTKFHDPADYSLDIMANDAVALLDHLGIVRAHVMGYSMGARIAAAIALRHNARVARLVLSGNGWGMVEDAQDWRPVHEALLADSLDQVSDPQGRAFRAFADQTGSDRVALAACISSVRQLLPIDALKRIENPVLVAVGTLDEIAGSGEKLAELFPHGHYLPIPGRDHMRAVGDKRHLQGVLDFLAA